MDQISGLCCDQRYTVYTGPVCTDYTRVRILGRNWDKSLEFSTLLFTVTFTNGLYPPPPSLLNKIKIGLKLFHDGSLKSESSEIMPRNLNEIVRSWIRLQGAGTFCPHLMSDITLPPATNMGSNGLAATFDFDKIALAPKLCDRLYTTQ